MLPQHRYSSCVCVMDGLLILFPGRGVVWLLSGDTEYSREETHSDETCAHTHTTVAPQHTVDNRVVCASLSAAEKKKKRRTCNVSSFHYKLSCLRRIPAQTRLLAAAAAHFSSCVVAWWVWMWSLLPPKRTQRADCSVPRYCLPCSFLSLSISLKRY